MIYDDFVMIDGSWRRVTINFTAAGLVDFYIDGVKVSTGGR